MAAVAVLTSVGAAAGPLGGVLGFLLSLPYLLVVGLSTTKNLFGIVSLSWAAAHIAVGCVAGLLVAFAGTACAGEANRRRSGRRARRCRSRRSWPRPQPALPGDRWGTYDDRLGVAGGSADRGDRDLVGARLLDTVMGCAIALVATYLLGRETARRASPSDRRATSAPVQPGEIGARTDANGRSTTPQERS